MGPRANQPPFGTTGTTGVLLQLVGAVPTVLVYSGFMVAIAVATTLNRHVRSTA